MGMQLVSALPVTAVTVPDAAAAGTALEAFAEQICAVTKHDENRTFFEEVRFDTESGILTADGEAVGSCGDLTVSGGDLMICSSAPESDTVQTAGVFRRFADAAAAYGYESEEDGGMLTVTNEFQTARLIVKAAGKIDLHGAEEKAEGYRDLHVLQYASTAQAYAAYQLYQQDPAVQYVQPSHIVTLDAQDTAALSTEADAGVSSLGTGSYMSWGADLIGTEDFYNTYLKGKELPEVRVAVIDSGLNTAPALFEGRILEGGVNFSGSGDDTYADDLSHGTHVTGTICELTPENVKILPIKSFNNKGSASDEQIYAGIMYALENGADVLNMSFGGLGVNPLEVEAMMIAEESGIICCAAAGNNADDARYYYPSSIQSCITVGAVDQDMERASFSNYGEMLDVAAPGVGILSYGIEDATKQETKNGTSMATPHVTACCALLCSYDREMTSARAENLLCLNAVDLGDPGFDDDTGWGMVCMKDFRWDAGICKAPAFSREEGNYGTAQTVEITAAHPEMQIYYTTDGSVPTRENGTLYTEPLHITESTRVTAVAVRKDYVDSVPVTAVFTIGGKDIAGALTMENGVVTGYRGIRQRVTIPETADGVPVTAVADNAFAGNQFVEKVVLPESVTEIGSGAFQDCKQLTELEAPGVTKVGEAAFSGAAALKTVKLSTELDTLGKDAFASCEALTALALPNVKSLPTRCFSGCTSLRRLGIPAVTLISAHACEGCTELNEIVADWRKITMIGENAFAGCKNYAGSLTLDSLELLGPGAFSGASALRRVSLPEFIDEIPDNAFSGCSGLRLLELPGAEKLGERALALGSSRDDLMLVMNYGKIRSLGADALYGLRLGNGFDTVTFSALKTLEPHSFGGAVAGIVELPLIRHVPEGAFAGAVIYGAALDAAETLDSGSLSGVKSVRLTSAVKTVAADACPTETWVVSAEQLPALEPCENIKPCYEPLVMRVSSKAMELRQFACGSFRITALGNGLTYQWYCVNEGETTLIPGADQPEYIPATGAQGESVYRCVITDAAGKQENCDVKAVIREPAVCNPLDMENPLYASGTEMLHLDIKVPETGTYVLEAFGEAPVNGTLTDEDGVLCGRLAMQPDGGVTLTVPLEEGKLYYLDAAPLWSCDYSLRLTAELTERTAISDCTVTVQQTAFGQYDEAYHPPLKVTAPNGTELKEGTDYTVRTARINMHYQLTLFGTGAYKGSTVVRTDLIDRIPADTPVPVMLSGKKDYANVLFIPSKTDTYYFYGGVDPHYLDEWVSYSNTGRVPGGYVYANVTANCLVTSLPAAKGTVYEYESMANKNESQFCGSMKMNAGQMYYFTIWLRENRDAKFTFIVSDRLRNIRDAELDGDFSAIYRSGKISEPETELIYEGRELTEGKDYIVLHSSNFVPGQAEITLIGTGLFIGKVNRKYEIIFPPQEQPESLVPLGETTAVACDDARMKTVWFRAELAENSYTNMRYRVLNEQTSGTEMLYRVYRLDEQLRSLVLMQPMKDEKNDYLLKNGVYCVCCTRKFRDRACGANITVVSPYSIQDAEMTVTDAVYTGGAVEAPVKLTMPDGTELKQGRDYVIAYPEDDANIMFGEVPFTIRSTKYSYGNGEGSYQIKVQLPENPPELTIGQHEVYLTKTERLGWYQLSAEQDTEFLLASDDIPDAVLRVFKPDAELDAQMHGSGPKALTFTVPAGETRYVMVKYNGLARTGTLHFRLETEQKALASCEVEANPVYWTGEHVQPDITIRDGEYTLVEGEDYAQRYIINDVDIGMASVNYIGKGKYVGMLDVDFQIRMDPESFYGEAVYGTWMPLMPLMLDYEYQIKNTNDDRYLLYSYYSVTDAAVTLSVFDARCKLAVQAYDEAGEDIGDAFINREGELTLTVSHGQIVYFLFSATDISGTNQQWKMQLSDQPFQEMVIIEDKENGLFFRAFAKADSDYAEICRIDPGRSTYRFEMSIMSEKYGYKRVYAINPGVFAMIPKSAVVYGNSSIYLTSFADYYHFLYIPLPYSHQSHLADPRGDLNMDGQITESDIVLFAALLAEHPAVDPELVNTEADMDGNGVLDYADLQLAAALITEYAVFVPNYGGEAYYQRGW